MNRGDLAWALQAVVPHVGTAVQQLDLVGISVGQVWATDRYTAAIAIVRNAPLEVDTRLPKREALDLMRFVRPSRVAHDTEDVVIRQVDNELHVGLVDENDTAVFQTVESTVTVDDVWLLLDALSSAPDESTQLVYEPDLFARFAKAKRVYGDRLRLYPKHVNGVFGGGIVVIEDQFIGAIAGLSYDDKRLPDLADYLQVGSAA